MINEALAIRKSYFGSRDNEDLALALEVAESRPSIYLDLESETGRARLAEPELYPAEHADKLVILDEIQRTPQLFKSLRIGISKAVSCG